MEHAQKIHRKRAVNITLPQNKRVNLRVAHQKGIIIQVLKGEIPAEETHIRIVKRWRKIHLKWIEYIKYCQSKKLSKKKAKEFEKDLKNGTIHWDKRWIRVYDGVLDYLNKLKNK